MALVMNSIHLLDATLVFYSYFSKALTQLFFFSFPHLLHLQSAIISSELSSKDLSPLLSKHLPSFPCSTVSSSRLRTSSLGWYYDSLGKGVYRKMKTTNPPYSFSKRTGGKGWALHSLLLSVPSSSYQPAIKPLKRNTWHFFFPTASPIFSEAKQSVS